jgi:outer membrane protein OmpA-like peptidoglycan-associated protein
MKLIGALLTVCALAAAQSPQAPDPVRQSAVRMLERTTKAFSYNRRGGSTKIDFRGTSLLPEARGEATVESKPGATRIQAHLQGMWPSTKFGPAYLTYVMWAITPEGGATNIGELLLDRGKTKLDATTELQSFGLIVTAEPYFAVTRPSDFVVMENFIGKDAAGTIEGADVKYELLARGQYTLNADPAEIQPPKLSSKAPLDLYEARNAVQIARWTGAERYAPDTFQKAVQMAEDARIITVRKIDEQRLAGERQAAAAVEAQANVLVTRNADTAQSESATMAAAKAEAGRLKRDSDAEPQKAELRARLLTQFGAILETRDTARGLIVNMSDLLFDTGQYSLGPLAREKLAQVAGIVSRHPGLRLDVEGYTDSAGAAVRDYLIQQGMPADSVASRGFDKTQPAPSNDTAQGRQQNRRVELVISGEIIGTEIGTPIAAR